MHSDSLVVPFMVRLYIKSIRGLEEDDCSYSLEGNLIFTFFFSPYLLGLVEEV